MPKGQAKMADKNCQTKACSYTCRPIQTNLDSDKKKTHNFRKFRKTRQIQTNSDKFRPKFRKTSENLRQIQTKIQTYSEKIRQIQKNSDKFTPKFGLKLSEFWSEFVNLSVFF